MNHWTILKRLLFNKRAKPSIAKTAYISSRAEVCGAVFVGDNSRLGECQLSAEENNIITIGSDTTIRNRVLVKANVSIGNKIFISSGVFIEGTSAISDGTFIGRDTMIVNSTVGSNCLIEDNVSIKNVAVPPNTIIPSKSVIHTKEKLEEIILITSQVNYCEFNNLSL